MALASTGAVRHGVPVARLPNIPEELTGRPFRGSVAVAEKQLTWNQLRGPAWRRLYRNIYVSAAAVLDHLWWCRAAALLLPPGAALSGLSAAFLLGVDLLPTTGGPVEVTVPRPARISPQAGLIVRRSELPASDIGRVGATPVTSALRTAFDLARRLPVVEGVVAVDALLRRGWFTVDGLRTFAAGRSGWPGAVQLRTVLGLAAIGAESPMETRLRLLLVLAGLPCPATQFEVRDRYGWFVARLDLAYAALRIGIEYDGDHHRQREVFQRDAVRLNRLRLHGWTVLRFTADDVLRHPDRVVAHVRAAIFAAGRARGLV